jgi:hypothetical protein
LVEPIKISVALAGVVLNVYVTEFMAMVSVSSGFVTKVSVPVWKNGIATRRIVSPPVPYRRTANVTGSESGSPGYNGARLMLTGVAPTDTERVGAEII